MTDPSFQLVIGKTRTRTQISWASGQRSFCFTTLQCLPCCLASYRCMDYLLVSSYTFFFFFLRPYMRHTEVARLGSKSELQPRAYATAIATLDPSCIGNLCCNLQKCWILALLSKARDWTCILMVTMSGSQPTEPQWELLVHTLCKDSDNNVFLPQCLVGHLEINSYYMKEESIALATPPCCNPQ